MRVHPRAGPGARRRVPRLLALFEVALSDRYRGTTRRCAIGVDMRSIRAEAAHQSVIPRSAVPPLSVCGQERRALSTGPHAQFWRVRFYIIIALCGQLQNVSDEVSCGRKSNPFQRL
jgi:hypothetical protein